MLLYRVLTSLLLAPLAAAAVFYLPLWAFALVFWMVAALACYEWAGFLNLSGGFAKSIYVVLFGALVGSVYILEGHTQAGFFAPILWFGCGVWLLACGAVLAFPSGEALFRSTILLGILGLLLTFLAWLSLVVIRSTEQGSIWLVWLFCLAWGADIGAYFAGRAVGKTPLAPAVSPAKTWEGVGGGVLLAMGVCGGAVVWWQGDGIFWLSITLLLIVIAVFGDLFESVIKRATGIKDSGTILPGHGGVLDRIDSLLAVLPFFALILYLYSGSVGVPG